DVLFFHQSVEGRHVAVQDLIEPREPLVETLREVAKNAERLLRRRSVRGGNNRRERGDQIIELRWIREHVVAVANVYLDELVLDRRETGLELLSRRRDRRRRGSLRRARDRRAHVGPRRDDVGNRVVRLREARVDLREQRELFVEVLRGRRRPRILLDLERLRERLTARRQSHSILA